MPNPEPTVPFAAKRIVTLLAVCTVPTAVVVARAAGDARHARQLRPPFLFVRSRDGDWVIAQAWDTANRLESNAHYTCLHTLPV